MFSSQLRMRLCREKTGFPMLPVPSSVENGISVDLLPHGLR